MSPFTARILPDRIFGNDNMVPGSCQLRDLVDRGALPAQAATTLASLWPGVGAPSGSEIAELLAATDRVVAECRGVEEATVVSARDARRRARAALRQHRPGRDCEDLA